MDIFFPVTIKHYSNNFVCKFWQLSLGWEEGQRASYFIKDCSEGFCNWSVSKIFLVDICLLAKEISLLPVILKKKSEQSKGGGSHSKGKVWVLDQKKRIWVSIWQQDSVTNCSMKSLQISCSCETLVAKFPSFYVYDPEPKPWGLIYM